MYMSCLALLEWPRTTVIYCRFCDYAIAPMKKTDGPQAAEWSVRQMPIYAARLLRDVINNSPIHFYLGFIFHFLYCALAPVQLCHPCSY